MWGRGQGRGGVGGRVRVGGGGQTSLLVGALVQTHLVSIARHQIVESHLLGLADAVAARRRLQVVLRGQRGGWVGGWVVG